MKAVMQKRDHLNGTSTGREAVGDREGNILCMEQSGILWMTGNTLHLF
jgi:hypothetical protein